MTTSDGSTALDIQIGGGHYKGMAIQPMEYSMKNGLDACQHTAIKYISRFREKGGLDDLEKAKHCIDLLIHFEKEKCANKPADPFPDTVLDIADDRIDAIARNGNDGEHYAEVPRHKVGDVVDIGGNNPYEITDLPGCADMFPDHYKGVNVHTGAGGLFPESQIVGFSVTPTNAEDMTNPANWRAGDYVKRTARIMDGLSFYALYKLTEVAGKHLSFIDQNGCPRTRSAAEFRFHSRPSQVNEAEMSGIWHHWSGGKCPCDESSYVEIERRNGFKTQRGAGFFDWHHKNVPGDIVKYRML